MSMVHYDTVLIRYGELSTKGKNKKDFIQRLYQNIRSALADLPTLVYHKTHDRIYIEIHDEDPQVLQQRLQMIFGISSFSFTYKVASNMEEMSQTCLKIAQESQAKTFKMIAKRHDKTFSLNSDQINRHIAGLILHETQMQVDVHHPQLPIQIEVRQEYTYITANKIAGAGGYPTGINGKVLLMLSGGIDSPVAAYQLMKRGLKVEAIHFASPPYTSDQARQKVMTLASQVAVYQGGAMKVHVVPFTQLQMEIYKVAGDPYAVTLMRRMMFRIAQAVAKKNGCLAIGTGESLGQVASQTLESMACINKVVDMPVLRPLVCYDKLEIIDLSRKIGTYETSILPYEDCCTIFDPKNPVTKPTDEKASEYESLMQYEALLEQTIQQTEKVMAKFKTEEDFL